MPRTPQEVHERDLSFAVLADMRRDRQALTKAARTKGIDPARARRYVGSALRRTADGRPCTEDSAGLLRRMPVFAAKEFRFVGKETDRRWEREDDINLLNPRLVEYRR